MRGLRLGLGMNNAAPTASAGADWTAFDNSNSAAITNLFTASGGMGQSNERMSLLYSSDTEAVLLYSTGDTSPTEPRAVVLDISSNIFQVETTNTALDLGGDTEGTYGIWLDDAKTRILFVQLNKPASPDNTKFSILSKSGKTLAELDSDTVSTANGHTISTAVTRLSDTKVAVVFAEAGFPGDTYTVVVDCASDTVTVGTPLALGTMSDTGEYHSVAAVSDSAYFVTDGINIHYITVSGTTPTNAGSLNEVSGGTLVINDSLVKNSDTTVLMVYQTSAANNATDAVVFTWTGSAITRGTVVTVGDDEVRRQGMSNLVFLVNNQYAYSYRNLDNSNRAYLITMSVSGTAITADTNVQTGNNVIGTGPVIATSDDGGRIFYVYVDASTSSQLGTRVLFP